jgi:hypothetical protein
LFDGAFRSAQRNNLDPPVAWAARVVGIKWLQRAEALSPHPFARHAAGG